MGVVKQTYVWFYSATRTARRERPLRLGRSVLAVFIGAVVASIGCGGPTTTNAAPSWAIATLEPVVSEESAALTLPYDLDLDAAGTVYVLDRRERRVLVVSPQGEIGGTIGSPGRGPGELQAPLALGAVGGQVRVLDYGNARVSVFSPAGELRQEIAFAPRGVPSGVAFAPDGAITLATHRAPGLGGLVMRVGPDGADQEPLGDLVAPEAVDWNFLAMREQIARQQTVPAPMRNVALPVAAPGGGTWLIVQSEGRLVRYDANDTMVLDRPLDNPHHQAMLDDFVRRNAVTQGSDFFFVFAVVADAFAEADRLWLLWNTPAGTPGLITLHDGHGELRARLILPALGDAEETLPPRHRIAVDGNRRRVYLTLSENSSLVAFPWPDGLAR